MPRKPLAADKMERIASFDDDHLLNASEIARLLGKHPGTVRHWILKGRLPATQCPHSHDYEVRADNLRALLVEWEYLKGDQWQKTRRPNTSATSPEAKPSSKNSTSPTTTALPPEPVSAATWQKAIFQE